MFAGGWRPSHFVSPGQIAPMPEMSVKPPKARLTILWRTANMKILLAREPISHGQDLGFDAAWIAQPQPCGCTRPSIQRVQQGVVNVVRQDHPTDFPRYRKPLDQGVTVTDQLASR